MNKDQISGTTNQLEQLFLRLLTSPYELSNDQPRLFVGALPEHFPIDVPVPEKTRVLGTLARSEEHVEMVLESELAPGDCAEFYREEFAGRGWSQPEHFRRMGGFAHNLLGPDTFLIFCQGEDGPSVTLNITQRENAATDVRIHFNLGREGNPCSQQRDMRRHMHQHDIIPPLVPPSGADQRPGGGGGGSDAWHSSAALKTDLELDALAQHYGAQLSKGGWTRTDTGTGGPVAWSAWTFHDEQHQPWGGLLFILKKTHKTREYALYVLTERERPDNASPSAEWFRPSSGSSTSLIINPRLKK